MTFGLKKLIGMNPFHRTFQSEKKKKVTKDNGILITAETNGKIKNGPVIV